MLMIIDSSCILPSATAKNFFLFRKSRDAYLSF